MTTTSPSLATASTSISYIGAMFTAESEAITPWVVLVPYGTMHILLPGPI